MKSEFMHLCTEHESFRFGQNEICRHCGARLTDGVSVEKNGPCVDPGHSKGVSVTAGKVVSWQCGCGRTWDERAGPVVKFSKGDIPDGVP